MKSRLFAFATAIDERQSNRLLAQKTAQPEESGVTNALEVNARTGAVVPFRIPDRIKSAYMGGRALAARLFAEFAVSDNPEGNPIIIASSPMNNTLTPYGDSFSIAFQSPVTTRFTVFGSLCSFGAKMRTLGLDAIVITGAGKEPSVLRIGKESSLEPNSFLAGMPTSAVDEMLRTSKEQCIIATGPASENGAPMAAPVSEGMTLGRGGLGLLMMRKGIKAIMITPEDEKLNLRLKTIVKDHQQKPEKTLEKLSRIISRSRYLGRTEFNMMHKGLHAGFVPTSSFRYRTDPRIFYLLSKKDINLSIYKKEIIENPLLLHSPEENSYSSFAMLGANLGCFNPEKIKSWENECRELGLDPISVGNVIGWAINERKEGRLPDYPELDDLSKKVVLRIINRLANPRGRKLFGLMALGAQGLKQSRLFDPERIYEISGLECGPYDYRGFITMAIDDYYGYQITCPCEPFMPLYRERPRRLAKFLAWNNNISEGLESIGYSHMLSGPLLCERESFFSFMSFFYPSLFLRFLNPGLLSKRFHEALGKKLKRSAFRDIGRACYLLETGINKVISPAEPQFPAYFAIEPHSASRRPQVVPFLKLKQRYEKERLAR